jgi:PAS domain-containing protein
MPEVAGGGETESRSLLGNGGDEEARLYAEAILGRMRQPLIVLDGDLRLQTANGAFYRTFDVDRDETEGRLIYELGNGQWDIPKLRELLEKICQTTARLKVSRLSTSSRGSGA